jgi:hypothetical protein
MVESRICSAGIGRWCALVSDLLTIEWIIRSGLARADFGTARSRSADDLNGAMTSCQGRGAQNGYFGLNLENDSCYLHSGGGVLRTMTNP